MLIIGLYGGTAPARNKIARQLEALELTRVNVLSVDLAPTVGAETRMRVLQAYLPGLDRRKHAAHLVVSHVESLEEADTLRNAGARLWFVEGDVSNTVPIQRGDLGVTDRPHSGSRYLSAEEALQQEVLSQHRQWKADAEQRRRERR